MPGKQGASSSFLEEPGSRPVPEVPDYLIRTYRWAYLTPLSIRLLDNRPVVSAILFGNYRRLVNAALAQFSPGQFVLQPACVYGDLTVRLARHLGPEGRLMVSDVAQLQVENCRRKLGPTDQVRLVVHDAAQPQPQSFDGICCFFLLHEMPDYYRRQVVESLLESVRPGGRAVFVDYHRPRAWHPLRPLMAAVFRFLEPFAAGLTETEINVLAGDCTAFTWTKRTFFGGLYQMVVAERKI